jgi:hypothetical protein
MTACGMKTSTKTRIARRICRIVGAVVDPLVLRYVQWSVRGEPIERGGEWLSSRIAGVLTAELDRRGEEVAKFRVTVEAAERAAVIQDFQSLEPGRLHYLQ